MKYNVEVIVSFKKGVLDPQSAAVSGAIASLGYDNIVNLTISKKFNFQISGSTRDIVEEQVDNLCRKLLANPVIENYHYSIWEEK
ncbi:phosphoribosylformylglycinamidine synthase [Anaerobranca californiensis DSM 14826]|jgi:phosphoribosylformylglycinamidine synthase|uniref:Phosphoribosylformylglycinamidine synthase subunit PurS n=1 Tax=Anaerobranca californiensis DSM 14826 TaxID=1120989 RepID=A0A1M6PWV1_9FIRM|nr:phosphoribosylformylglycinamidine synthase subunit PurS [Anaerobranca californiensis]SHK12368.1 phosphoribosylformylglycinamidine synthase [Anaerobranca californiensis DSM 14826]